MKKDTKITESIDSQCINMDCRAKDGSLLAFSRNIDVYSIESIKQEWEQKYGNRIYIISIHFIYN